MKKLSLIILSALTPFIANANNEKEEPSVLEFSICEGRADVIEYAEQYMNAILEKDDSENSAAKESVSEIATSRDAASSKDDQLIKLALKD